jgi:hypothetical protein
MGLIHEKNQRPKISCYYCTFNGEILPQLFIANEIGDSLECVYVREINETFSLKF